LFKGKRLKVAHHDGYILNLKDMEVNLITNMPIKSGIGSYSMELYRILKPSLPGLTLYSYYYKTNEVIPWSVDISQFHTNNFIMIPYVTRKNLSKIRRSKKFLGKNIHILGADYSLVSETDKAIGTVHEFYFTVYNIPRLRNFGEIAKEFYYNYNLLKLSLQIKKFKKIIAPSLHAAKQIKKHTGIEPVVIHETVDDRKFHHRDKSYARRILNLDGNLTYVLNVSGGGTNKNLETLKKIANLLPNNCKLVKIGFPIDSKNSINVGNVEDDIYPLFFNAADVYINVSTNEGFNIPLIESLKSSLPIVSNRCATSFELLGESGIYLDNSYDSKQYLEMILYLLDDKTHEYYSNLSYTRSLRFSEDEAREKYLKVYSEVFG